MLGIGVSTTLSMIKRLRDNAALLKKRRYFKSGGHDVKVRTKVTNVDVEFTPEYQQALRRKLKMQRQKSIILSVISLQASIAITYALVYYLF